jgi:hypothetical protein
MSYRALFSIVQGDDQRDYKILLDEEFKNGEELAEAVMKAKTFGDAILYLAGGVLGPAIAHQQHWSSEDRAKWLETWADQWWVVRFTPDGDYVKVEITGTDASDNMIFFRSRLYCVG